MHHAIMAIEMAATMGWQMLWALCLGFLLSSVIESVVSKDDVSGLLPDARPGTVALASALGAASSSCSYAAAALARSLFRKGADFVACMAFMFASTNLVVELSVLLFVLLGWQFMAAEFVGGPIMIALMVLMLRSIVRPQVERVARQQAEQNRAGKMEGHAAMDMSVKHGSFLQKVTSAEGFTAISHYYFMNWSSLWADIALGLGISGLLAALVPNTFWQGFFLAGHPLLAKFWGPSIGPLVAVLSFVCSVGNVPMAAVLWNGGISFGGVLAFLFADLIIVPLINIYRKYYGGKIAAMLFFVFYASMSLAALAVEGIFTALHWIPQQRSAHVMEQSIRMNYTSILNLILLAISAVLLVRFLRTGGPAMLREMDKVPADGEQHHCCEHQKQNADH